MQMKPWRHELFCWGNCSVGALKSIPSSASVAACRNVKRKSTEVSLTKPIFLSADKPDPPAGTPCASDIRSSSLTLSWYGSSYDGGSAVQSYSVEIWNTVDNKWTDLATCRSTSYNVQDLLADREYKFRVRAVNVYGISEPSQQSDPVKVGEKQEGKSLRRGKFVSMCLLYKLDSRMLDFKCKFVSFA